MLIFLVLFIVMVAAGAYLFQGETSEPFDEAEISRLVAEKRAQLSSGAATDGSGMADAGGYASRLYIESVPSGAVVILDNDTIGVTPMSGRAVESGVYVLSIRKDHYSPMDTVVFILGEEPTAQFFVDLEPVRTAVHADSRTPMTYRESSAASSGLRGETRRADSSIPATPARRRQVESESASTDPATRPVTGISVTAETPADVRRPVQREAMRSTTSGESAATSGLVTVLVRPWGSIFVDGALEKVNTDVQHTTSLPLGRHVIRAEHPALGSRERVVEIRRDQPQTVVFDLLEPSPVEERTNSANSPQPTAETAKDGSES